MVNAVRRFTGIAVCMVVMVAGTAAQANIISFDPDGAGGTSGPLAIQSFDFRPANALSHNVQELDSTSVTYTQYAQGRLGSFSDGNSNPLNVPELNNDYEITIVAQYNGVTTQPISTLPLFTLTNTGVGPSMVQLWFDDSPDADALSGDGYADGTMIFEGTVSFVTGIFQVTGGPSLFDRVTPDNYAGQQSVVGNGSVDVVIEPTYLDPDFFKTDLIEVLFRSNSSTPFTDVNPSQTFDDGAVSPSLGPVNSPLDLNDFQFQTDGTASFLVPEPSSLVLIGLGGMALFRRRSA